MSAPFGGPFSRLGAAPQEPAVGTAFVSGLRRHPILGPAFDAAAEAFGYDRQRLAALERQIGAETTSEKLAGLVGELGPDFVLAGGVYGIGRAAGLGVLRAAAAGRTSGQLGLVAARAARDAELAAGRLGALRPLGVPWAETAAKAAGGQAATAAFFGSEEFLRSGDARAALQTAAISAAIGGVLEGAAVGLGGLTSRARAGRLDQPALRAQAVTEPVATLRRFLESGERPRAPVIAGRLRRISAPLPVLRERLDELGERLTTAISVDQNASNLVKASELQRELRTLPKQIRSTQQQIARAETLLDSIVRFSSESGADILLTTNKPFAPRGVRRVLLDVGRQIALTPESLFGRLGATAARMFSGLSHADMRINLTTSVHHEAVTQARWSALKAIGLSPSTRDPAKRELLWRTMHEWEQPGGSAAAMVRFLVNPPEEWARQLPRKVSREQAEEFARQISSVDALVQDVGGRVVQVGAEAAYTADDLAALRVSRYWPHLSDPGLSDVELAGRLEAVLGSESAAREAMLAAEGRGWLPSQRERRLRGPTREVAQRIGQFGSFDFARTTPGTGFEKLRAGLPINDDPFDSALRMLKAGERRFHLAQVVGPKGELVDVVADGVEREAREIAARQALASGERARVVPSAEGKESANLFTNIMDEMLDHRHYQESVHRLVRTVTSFNIASKLALAIIPQLTQVSNNTFLLGLGATLRGFKGVVDREARHHTEMALAIPHITNRAMSGALDAGVFSQRSERIAEGILRWTGFTAIEKLWRIHSYHSGNAYFRDTLLKAAEGRLRGTELDRAFRALADLGVDLSGEVQAYRRLGPTAYFNTPRVADLTERVGFRAAQLTQFIPSALRRPTLWNTPFGRVLFQFKTFALSQARLIKDTVLAEAALGNVKPLAYWLSFTPLSGAFVLGARDLFREKPHEFNSDSQVFQAAELFMAAGGFGLAGDAFSAALRGDLLGLVAGPTVSQVTDIAESMVRRDSDALIRFGTRLPLTRLATQVFSAGAGGVQLSQEIVTEYLRAQQPGGRATVDLGTATLQKKMAP